VLPPSGGGGLVQNTVQQQPAFTRSETRRRLLRPHSLQPRSPEKRRSTHARTQRPFPSSRCTHLRLEATASVPVPLGVHAGQVAPPTAAQSGGVPVAPSQPWPVFECAQSRMQAQPSRTTQLAAQGHSLTGCCARRLPVCQVPTVN